MTVNLLNTRSKLVVDTKCDLVAHRGCHPLRHAPNASSGTVGDFHKNAARFAPGIERKAGPVHPKLTSCPCSQGQIFNIKKMNQNAFVFLSRNNNAILFLVRFPNSNDRKIYTDMYLVTASFFSKRFQVHRSNVGWYGITPRTWLS